MKSNTKCRKWGGLDLELRGS